jgi:hypothetical protein
MPATPLTECQATQWKKVKQLHALAERAPLKATRTSPRSHPPSIEFCWILNPKKKRRHKCRRHTSGVVLDLDAQRLQELQVLIAATSALAKKPLLSDFLTQYHVHC